MADQFIDTDREIIRQSLDEGDIASVENTNPRVNNALDYFERDDDHKHVRAKMKTRGAIGIKKKEGEAGYETYTKQRTSQMIESGEMEVITSGTGAKILGTLSSLFTNPTQSWTYLSEDDEPLEEEDVAELFAHREAGGFETSLPQADWISNAVGTGPLLLSWSSGHLTYNPFSPACLYAKYHDFISDNSEPRGVNYKDLEDATVVVVETNAVLDTTASATEAQFIAFFGRSTDYPYGRMVQYKADAWDGWPDANDPNAIDYRLDSGEIANPLSWLAATGEGTGVEYPIIMIDGGISVTHQQIAPVSTSLFENCLEIDVAFSRLLKDSLENALGTKAIKSGMTTHLPRTLSGAVHLMDDQEMQIHFVPNSNADIAFKITKEQARAIAESHGVPGYIIISEAGALPESGIALAIRTQPLIQNRNTRISLNKTPVAKMFDIERGLYQFHRNEPLLPGTRQVWNPGRFIMPENELDKLNRLSTALDKRAISYVRYIRDLHNLATDDDAVDYIEEMARQDAEFPAPVTVQPRAGLPAGIQPRGPRGV
jgi:hypothetical protein